MYHEMSNYVWAINVAINLALQVGCIDPLFSGVYTSYLFKSIWIMEVDFCNKFLLVLGLFSLSVPIFHSHSLEFYLPKDSQ